MEERRTIRVLTAYNRLYVVDKGPERGTAANQGRLLETELNKTLAKGHLTVRVIFVPVRAASAPTTRPTSTRSTRTTCRCISTSTSCR
jgi:hypothetical protein